MTSEAHARWQELAGSSDTSSVLDVVRHVVEAVSAWPLLVRALAVTPVYLRVAEDSRVETSRAEDGDYAHAWSSPVRLTAGLGADVDELTIQEVFVADLVSRSGSPLGIRIDPQLASEMVVPPPMAQEVVAVAAGLPVPAALTPAAGEELRVQAGPQGLTDLDRRVRDAVRQHSPRARIVRAAATLVGLGGRVWPVYSVSSAVPDPLALSDVVQRAAQVPLVLLVDGHPPGLAEVVDVDAHGVDLATLDAPPSPR